LRSTKATGQENAPSDEHHLMPQSPRIRVKHANGRLHTMGMDQDKRVIAILSVSHAARETRQLDRVVIPGGTRVKIGDDVFSLHREVGAEKDKASPPSPP
jgi:hypothetical protein